MKKFNLLFVCLAFAAGLQAQQVQTLVQDTWDGTTWQPATRITYSYDANCLTVSLLLESWDIGSGTWNNYILNSYTNNPDGTVAEALTQSWNGGTSTWVNQSRTTYTYTGFGKQATSISEYWQNNKWKNASRVTNTYDGSNYLINQLTEISLGGSNWINGSQTLYTNNPNGSISQAIVQGWDFVFSQWKDQSRLTYTYYNNDPTKILTTLNEIWDGSAWQNGTRTTNTYNPGGVVTSSLDEAWDGLTWVNSSLESLYYQADGTTLDFIIAQNWDAENGVWVNASRSTLTYGPCVLPLTLLNFNAVKQNSKVQLSWKTANEINTSSFGIQRSTDARNFITVGTINAAGTSAEQNSYNFVDDIATLKANKIYYRLQQLDKDGKGTYSNIVSVSVSGGVKYSILPNPARSYFTIIPDGSTDLTNATVTIVNLAGKKLLTQKLGNGGQQQINISSLPKGLYMVNIVTAGNVVTQKLVVE
ncbi:MAG: T9SS type A sorting domain-containing protein [Panacibacter sp.]